jgi:hypothetical protein
MPENMWSHTYLRYLCQILLILITHSAPLRLDLIYISPFTNPTIHNIEDNVIHDLNAFH